MSEVGRLCWEANVECRMGEECHAVQSKFRANKS